MKKFLLLLLTALMAVPSMAQTEASMPTIIAFPSRLYMNKMQFGQDMTVNGRSRFVPDYDKAFLNDAYLKTALQTISSSLKDRGYEVEMLEAKLQGLDQQAAYDDASGAAKSIDDQVMEAANPDIRLEVEFYVSSTLGPRKGWEVKVSAVDAYTFEPVGSFGATVDPTSKGPDLVLREVIAGHLENFSGQLMNYFRDLHDNGRKVKVNFFSRQNGPNLEDDEYEDAPLNEYLEDWLKKFALNKNCRTNQATEHRMECTLRIPFFDAEGAPIDVKQWVRPLRNEIKKGIGIPATIKLRGLGQVDILLGDK